MRRNGKVHFSRQVQVGGALMASVMLALSACGSSDENEMTIQSGFYSGAFPSLVAAVAEYEGFFDENGVNFEPIVMDGGAAAQAAALSSGDLDVAPFDLMNVMIANSEGANFRFVVGNSERPSYTLVVSSDVDLPHEAEGYPAVMQDLEGLTIGVTALGSGSDTYMSLLLSDAGLPDDWTTQVAVSGNPAQVMAALDTGQIDGYMSLEPITSLIVSSGGRRIVDMLGGEGPEILDSLFFNGYIAAAPAVSANPELFHAFAAAMSDAIDFMLEPANSESVLAAFKEVGQAGDSINDEVLLDALVHEAQAYSASIGRQGYEANVELVEHFDLIPPDEIPAYEDVISVEIMPPGETP